MEQDKEKEVIMALDVSTNTIGVCVFLNDGSEYGKIIELTHVQPKISKKIEGFEALAMKCDIFNDSFLMKWKGLKIDKVVIEAPLIESNNAYTAAQLLRFNGMIAYSVHKVLGIIPEFISSYDARMYSFPDLLAIRKYNKKGEIYPKKNILSKLKKNQLVMFGQFPWDCDKKTILWNRISELFPDVEWLYNKKGELKKENFDSTDAYVVALGYTNKKRFGEIKPIVTQTNITDDYAEYTVSVFDKKIIHKIYFS